MSDTIPGLARVLDRIERAGNRLPHPATLFVLLTLLVIGLSALAARAGVTVAHPTTGAMITATDLASVAGSRRLMLELLPNFMNFGPLGPVLVCLLGLSVAEQSGLLGALVRVIVGATPARWLTLVVVFVGAMSHTVGDVGYVLLIPLAASLFHAVGRHPLAGLAAAFAGVSGGFAANLLLSPTDLVLAGLTQEAARIIDPAYSVAPTASYFFLAASVALITVTGTVVTEQMVVPRLGTYTGDAIPTPTEPLTPLERRGLWWALASMAALATLVAWGLRAPDGFLLDPERPGFVSSFFLRGLVFWIFVFGLVPGVVYGAVTGRIRRDRDVYKAMADTLGLISGYVVVVFFIAQFIAVFGWSNLGVLLGVKGAAILKAAGLGAIPLLVSVVLLTATVDLFIGSASAKWAMLGTIVVPMLMLLGLAPELTQTAYRVGDSLTNIITPLSANFPLVLMYVQRYRPEAGIGTLAATMLPYTIVNAVAWLGMLVVWVWLGWPTGPGAPLFLSR